MFCKKCGAPIKPEQKKCPSCGEPVPDLSYFMEWPKAPVKQTGSESSVPLPQDPPPTKPNQAKNFARQMLKDLDQIKKSARRTPRMLLLGSMVILLCVLLTLVQISGVKTRLEKVDTKLTQLSIEAERELEEKETSAVPAIASEPTETDAQSDDVYTEDLERTLSVSSLTLGSDEMLELSWDDDSVYFCIACQGNTENGIRYIPLIEVSGDYGNSENVRYSWTSEDGRDLTDQVDVNGILTLGENYLERYISGNLTLRLQCSAAWTNDAGGSITVNVGSIVVTYAEQSAE